MSDKRVGVVIEGKAAVAPAFRQVKREFDVLKAASKGLSNVITGIGQGIGQRFAGVAFDAVRSVTDVFTQAVPKALAYARTIDGIADATGASAAQASILAGTLKMLDIPTDGLATTFRSLSSEIVTNEAKFNALGIKIRDNGGNLINTVSILDNVRSALANMGDGAAKTALAVDLFGRQALTMMDYLSLSDEAAANAASELERMGLVLTDETVRAAEDADRSFALLGMSIDGLQVQLASNLLPAIINIVNAIRNWVMENRDGLIRVLAQVAGALSGFVSGVLGATDAMSGFINSLRSSGSAVDQTRAGIEAQIAALRQQRDAYGASAGGAGKAGGASDKLTASLTKQINKLRAQRDALMEVARAHAEQADAAFKSMLAGLDANERAYQLDQRRADLNDRLTEAQNEQAAGAAEAARELQLLREEAQLAIAGEADPDRQFAIAADYAMREQRMIEQHAEEATRLEKAVADRRKEIADFEVEVTRQAAMDKARAEIEAAQEVSSRIQELATADNKFKRNLVDLRALQSQLQSEAEIARESGNTLLLQAIEQNLASVRQAIRTQEEARRIKQHERELERQKERAASYKNTSNAVLATINAEIKRLEAELVTYDNTNKRRMDAVNLQEKLAQRLEQDKPGLDEYVKSFKDWAKAGQDVARSLERIGRALEAIASVVGFGADIMSFLQMDWLFGKPSVDRRAKGGPVGAGKPYIVGEEGPELFVPNTSGGIVPNGAMGGGGISVTIQAGAYLGSAADAREFAQRVYNAMQEESSRRFGLSPRGAF